MNSNYVIRPDYQNSTKRNERFFVQDAARSGRNVIAANLTKEEAGKLVNSKRLAENDFNREAAKDAY